MAIGAGIVGATAMGGKKVRTGRKSVFRDKSVHIHGKVTKAGAKAFEEAADALRHLVALLTRREVEDVHVSDGDVIEYLARGHRATADYLKREA